MGGYWRLLTGHSELERQVLDLTQELMILKRMPRFKNQPPKQQKNEQTKADASCQTWNQSSMKIENPSSSTKAPDQVHFSQEEDILYQSVHKEIHREGEDGG